MVGAAAFEAHPPAAEAPDDHLVRQGQVQRRVDFRKLAQRFGLGSKDCVVFEDSINGLRSACAAKMRVVGLLTTNPIEKVRDWSHIQIPDYVGISYDVVSGVW